MRLDWHSVCGECQTRAGSREEEATWTNASSRCLRAIVTDYVSSQEPVGSKALVERHDLGVSPATVRNDMAALEEEGYITQPHTSAGRIPTDKGYRLFVDRLGSVKPLSSAEQRAIQTFLSGAIDLDDVLLRTVRLLAQVTQQVAIVQYPTLSHSTVRHVEIVSLSTTRLLLILITSTGRIEQRALEIAEHDEDTLAELRAHLNAAAVGHASSQAAVPAEPAGRRAAAVAGADRPGRIATLLEMLSSETSSRLVVGGMPNLTRYGDGVRDRGQAGPGGARGAGRAAQAAGRGDHGRCGHGADRAGESRTRSCSPPRSWPVDTAVTVDTFATLGVLGPTRMDYPSTMASVRAVARYVGRFLSEG